MGLTGPSRDTPDYYALSVMNHILGGLFQSRLNHLIDPASGFSAENAARDLHAALVAAGERAPWVMTGHSLGGAYVLTFTRLYGPEVSGIVMVDASHPDQLSHFRAATGKDRSGGSCASRCAAWAPARRIRERRR